MLCLRRGVEHRDTRVATPLLRHHLSPASIAIASRHESTRAREPRNGAPFRDLAAMIQPFRDPAQLLELVQSPRSKAQSAPVTRQRSSTAGQYCRWPDRHRESWRRDEGNARVLGTALMRSSVVGARGFLLKGFCLEVALSTDSV